MFVAMFVVSEKKHVYWNHWVACIFVSERGTRPHGMTGARLAKVKSIIWNDDSFWSDILLRHSGFDRTPEQMKAEDLITYDHMIGNFTGMVYQSLIESGLVRP